MTAIRPYAKAIISLVSAAIAAVIIALSALPAGAGLGSISTLAWFVIAAAVVAQAALVFGVPNKEA